jgi:hypothetical protein
MAKNWMAGNSVSVCLNRRAVPAVAITAAMVAGIATVLVRDMVAETVMTIEMVATDQETVTTIEVVVTGQGTEGTVDGVVTRSKSGSGNCGVGFDWRSSADLLHRV